MEIPENIPKDSTFVDLSSNSLVSFDDDAFPSLPNCVRLYLNRTRYQRLKRHHLNENKLTDIRGDMWEGLTKLTGLYLESNQIGRLSRTSFSISSQDGDFSSSLTSCTILSLANNLISEVEAGTFSDLVHLECLKLKGNKLTEVRADMWQGLGNLGNLFFFFFF